MVKSIDMTEREKKCFDDVGGGRWGEEHSDVLAWADSHPIWKVAADGLPDEDGEYLVVVESLDMNIRYTEICDYDKKHKSFTCWDYYNDSICTYKKKDIKYWMKIPDYK